MGDFKVLKVVSATELVINCGTNDGVTSRARFLIYSLGEELTDPDDGRAYERLEITKGTAEVKHVQATICTVETAETYNKRVAMPGLVGLQGTTETVTVPKPFDDAQVGDFARWLNPPKGTSSIS
jgi:hypothetical protein